jgi:hypothetical protein
MINYPKANIGNNNYKYYWMKYGPLLKNIQYAEYKGRFYYYECYDVG